MNEYNELNNHPLLLLYPYPVVVNPPDQDFLVNTDDEYLTDSDGNFLVDG